MYDVIIVGGGAAGMYGAVRLAAQCSDLKILVLEQSKTLLSKVRISGGGRCNVTHAQFDPSEFVRYYPRGKKELLGPLYEHGSKEIIKFFEDRGVPLKTEDDGRIFPVSDDSMSIVDALLKEADKTGISIWKSSGMSEFNYQEGQKYAWEVTTSEHRLKARVLWLATGSNKRVWNRLAVLGHTIIQPVPSLFTFNSNNPLIGGLQGISSNARVELVPEQNAVPLNPRNYGLSKDDLVVEGPVLITHWGLSGPAVLRISSWASRLLFDLQYRFRIRINWLPDYHSGAISQILNEVKIVDAKKTVYRSKVFQLPGRLWKRIVETSGISQEKRWAELKKAELQNLSDALTAYDLEVNGKSTFKEEFVTAGGVSRREVNFKTFESKKFPGLYFSGEILDIDAITGGFNFQNAWTGAYVAAKAIVKVLE